MERDVEGDRPQAFIYHDGDENRPYLVRRANWNQAVEIMKAQSGYFYEESTIYSPSCVSHMHARRSRWEGRPSPGYEKDAHKANI